MNIFRFFLAVFFLFFSAQSVSAQEDFIAPAKFSFDVQPGETVNHQIIYKSGIGGTYDLSARQFTYDTSGNKVFKDEPLALVEFPTAFYEFQPGQEQIIPVRIRIPVHASSGDVYSSLFIRRRSDEVRTFELGSLLFLRIGETRKPQARISNIQFQRKNPLSSDTRGGFHSIAFDIENLSGRYFGVTPKLELYDSQNVLIRTLENPSSFVFPEFTRTIHFSNNSDTDLETNGLSKVLLKVFAEDQTVLHEEELQLPRHEMFFSQQRPAAPFSVSYLQSSILQSSDGKNFLKHPVFQGFVVVIVLILVVFPFFLKRK